MRKKRYNENKHLLISLKDLIIKFLQIQEHLSSNLK